MKKVLISIIAAIGSNRELGLNNQLLWHIPEDLKRFKKLTQGHVVIMGRKTYESIGKPLPNRLNIIISRDPCLHIQNCLVAHSLKEALKLAKEREKKEIFIIGGASVYAQAINLANKLYLTVVDSKFDADAFFPDYSVFAKKVFEKKSKNKQYSYTFIEMVRDGPQIG